MHIFTLAVALAAIGTGAPGAAGANPTSHDESGEDESVQSPEGPHPLPHDAALQQLERPGGSSVRALAAEPQAAAQEAPAYPRFALFTRVFEPDAPFLNFFLDWYLALGFDVLIVLDASQPGADTHARTRDRVAVHRVENSGNGMFAEHFHLVVETGAEWVLSIDSDEFLLLDVPTVGGFVDRVQRGRGPVDLFYFRWALADLMRPFCADEPFARVVKKHCRTPHFLHKHMARVSAIKAVRPHCIVSRHPAQPLAMYHDGQYISLLRPNLACAAVNTFDHRAVPAYADSALAWHTRLDGKTLRSPSDLVALMKHAPAMDPTQALRRFVDAVGMKAGLPLNNMVLLPRRFRALHGGSVGPSFVRQMMATLVTSHPFAARRGMCAQRIERLSVHQMITALSNSTVTMREYEAFAQAISRAYVLEAEAHALNASRPMPAMGVVLLGGEVPPIQRRDSSDFVVAHPGLGLLFWRLVCGGIERDDAWAKDGKWLGRKEFLQALWQLLLEFDNIHDYDDQADRLSNGNCDDVCEDTFDGCL
ncbi:hypothetical protein T492DRAFT_858880 [Pavlovales sp. CCMP2436]|nr:hypothetical protein T492DRAFT_858880 [Pavlovales sp. CCMP2436]